MTASSSSSSSSSPPTPDAPPLSKGTYAHSGPGDVRSPCPLINCLANHGYLPRDGRNVRVEEVKDGLNHVGLSRGLGAVFSNPIFLEAKNVAPTPPQSFLARSWFYLRNPWAILAAFGMRHPGQVDADGARVLNLDQLALPDVVEHDISLTRRDHQQGDNISIQPDLLADLLACSSDGGKTLTAEDLVALRLRRIERQRHDNPGLHYGALQHQIGCAEIALILHVFGDGERLRCDYARAFFGEERLPLAEGWTRRRWWTLGLVELGWAANKVKKMIGLDIKD